MSVHVATISWTRQEQVFLDNRYSRSHEWRFDGGSVVHASSAPTSAPVPLSDVTAVDPEEAFVATLSSCHMLWFLSIAAKRGFVVDSYLDEAEGILEMGADGRVSITRVYLRPRVRIVGTRRPDHSQFEALHHEAHDRCFIANSVKTDVRCEAVLET